MTVVVAVVLSPAGVLAQYASTDCKWPNDPESCASINCRSGYGCNSCGDGRWQCVNQGAPLPTATPPSGGGTTPGATATPGGGAGPPLTPVPTTACSINCNRQVCGDTASSCSSNADCGSPYTCNTSSGKCQLCTNPGVECCGYCVPQGWGCSGSACASYKSCKAWNGGVLICDMLTGCANANPCANASGATSSTCYGCFEYRTYAKRWSSRLRGSRYDSLLDPRVSIRWIRAGQIRC